MNPSESICEHYPDCQIQTQEVGSRIKAVKRHLQEAAALKSQYGALLTDLSD